VIITRTFVPRVQSFLALDGCHRRDPVIIYSLDGGGGDERIYTLMKDSHKRDGLAIKKNVFSGLKILGCRVLIMFLLLLFFSHSFIYIFSVSL